MKADAALPVLTPAQARLLHLSAQGLLATAAPACR